MKIFYYILALITLFSCKIDETKSAYFKGTRDFNPDIVLKKAKKENKKVLLYFSSLACINCRKMEKIVLNNSKIEDEILKNYKLVTLIVDDREIADKSFWKNSKTSNKILETIGSINSNWQLELTQYGSQPYFVILGSENNVSLKLGFTESENEILDFLK